MAAFLVEMSTPAIFDEIAAILREMSAYEGAPITEATELYYDLGLAGDDLEDVITEVSRRFGADFSHMKLGRYSPGETSDFDLNLIRQLREWRGERTYGSLTVGSLVSAVQAGRWRDR